MILTDYFRGQKLTQAKSRFDITAKTGEYEPLERLLQNVLKFNIGGLSFNLVSRPEKWEGRKTDMAITKGQQNITSVKRPDLETNMAYGDIRGTQDGCIIVFNPDFKEAGITTVELFIARGLRNDTGGLWTLFSEGELDHEVNLLRSRAVTIFVTGGG